LAKAGIAAQELELTEVNAEFVEQTQAGGFRQLREGLAYRLCFSHPPDRAAQTRNAEFKNLTWRRKVVYRIRNAISKWSHRMSWLAGGTGYRTFYIRWARLVATLYAEFAWSQGRLGRFLDRLGLE
jgi:hypothetical protein